MFGLCDSLRLEPLPKVTGVLLRTVASRSKHIFSVMFTPMEKLSEFDTFISVQAPSGDEFFLSWLGRSR
jgi:hypothetical protein